MKPLEAAEEKQHQNAATQATDAGEVTKFDHICYGVVQCRDATGNPMYEEDVIGRGDTIEDALLDMKRQCDKLNCADHENEMTGPLTRHCCNSLTAPYPCVKAFCPGRIIPAFATALEAGVRYEYFAIVNDGKPLSRASILGPDRAWKRFKALAAARGGIVPGTLRVRVSTPELFLCYVRVHYQHGTTLEDIEVEGKGDCANSAKENAVDAARRLVELLAYAKVLPGTRCISMQNNRTNACRQSEFCRHQCEAQQGGLTIITSRHGVDRQSACAAAMAAAVALADQFGGVKSGSCKEITELSPANAAQAKASTDCCGGK